MPDPACILPDDTVDADIEPDTEDEAIERAASADDATTAAVAASIGSGGEDAQLQAMLTIARKAEGQPDARVRWLADWVKTELAPAGQWNARRLILFTEWEATRFWLQRRLSELLDDLEPDERIAAFTGATPSDRRETLKRRFNSDPAVDPLRVLICTDAAREGINLQARCHDLVHFDLPWNPARLEQRNGRIDRKLQPSPIVTCRYFVFEQRPEDVVLDALVNKTELIREQLGSFGQVLAGRLEDRLSQNGIVSPGDLAREVETMQGDEQTRLAREELDDATERRRARQKREIDDLRRLLDASRDRVGVAPGELQAAASVALARAGTQLDREAHVNGTAIFRLDTTSPLFAASGWPEALDTLRIRRRKRNERVRDWRADAPIKALSFQPAITADGADAEGPPAPPRTPVG